MNRNAINSVVFGSTYQSTFVRGLASQTLRLIGSATGTITHYGQIAQTLSMRMSIELTRKVSGSISGALSLIGDATGNVLHYTYGVLTQRLGLNLVGDSHLITRTSINQELAVSGVVTPTVLTRVFGFGEIVLRLGSVFTGSDYALGDAPEDRTTGIVDLTTQSTDAVGIGA